MLTGVAPAVSSSGFSRLVDWIECGYAGSMDYFANRLSAYEHPRSVLDGVRSLVVLMYPYDASSRSVPVSGHGRIARYVGDGRDYHDVIHPKLRRLGKLIASEHPGATVRGIVDTAPLMEREVAVTAGIGWQGKNTLLLNRHHGSYFLLACLLTSVELPTSEPHASSHCGTCTACLDACPTQAFPRPGVLDATRCVSYLTIEHDGPIAEDLRHGMGDWLFGCDVCQDVCPWNRKISRRSMTLDRITQSLAAHPTSGDSIHELAIASLFELDDAEFRARFRKTPFWRSRRRGMLRNAAIVLGNQRSKSGIPPLQQGLHDDEPLVRGASAWALGQIGGELATESLRSRGEMETDGDVASEIIAAISVAESQQTS